MPLSLCPHDVSTLMNHCDSIAITRTRKLNLREPNRAPEPRLSLIQSIRLPTFQEGAHSKELTVSPPSCRLQSHFPQVRVGLVGYALLLTHTPRLRPERDRDTERKHKCSSGVTPGPKTAGKPICHQRQLPMRAKSILNFPSFGRTTSVVIRSPTPSRSSESPDFEFTPSSSPYTNFSSRI